MPIAKRGQIPVVSIIVTFHQQAEFVRDCLRSFREQTIKVPFEIIAVDDGSLDETGDIIQAEFPDVRYLRVEFWQANRARNAGKDIARGKFLGWFDGDDWARPQYLEKLHAALLAHPEADIAYARFNIPHIQVADGRVPACNHFEWSRTWLQYAPVINTPTLIRRALADKVRWDERIRSADDWVFSRRMAEEGATAVQVREVLWDYRPHAASLWGSGQGAIERPKSLAIMKQRWPTFPKKPEVTFVSIITEPETAAAYFRSVRECRMPARDMHWLIIIETEDEAVVEAVKAYAAKIPFHTTRIFVTNEPPPGASFIERARRRSRNIKICVNDCHPRPERGGTPFIFVVEDGTTFDADAFVNLKAILDRDEKVAIASAAGIDDPTTLELGFATLKTTRNGTIVRRATPEPDIGTDPISVNAVRWRCWMGRSEALKRPHRCEDDGRDIEPSEFLAYDLTRRGWKVIVDPTTTYQRWNGERWRDLQEARGSDIGYRRDGDRWRRDA